MMIYFVRSFAFLLALFFTYSAFSQDAYSSLEKNEQDKKVFLLDYAPKEIFEPPRKNENNEIDIFSTDEKGRTPLMLACKNADFESIRLLLEKGADVEAKDNEGWTPLMYAIRYNNNIDYIELLLSYDALVRIQNKFGLSPLLLCAEYSTDISVLATILSSYNINEDEVFKSFIYTITSSSTDNFTKKEKISVFIQRGIPINRFGREKHLLCIWQKLAPLPNCFYSF